MSSELNAPGGTSTAPSKALQEKFQTARLAAASCWPFMATALLRMVPRWSNIVPTLAVDRVWRLYLNPQFVEENTPAQLALLLVGHELQHALGDHADRLSEYRHDLLLIGGEPVSLANVAHDLAINSNLQSFVTSATNYRNSISRPPIPMECPTKALYPSKFKDGRGKPYPDGLVSEAYAELLKKLPKIKSPFPVGKGKGDGSGQAGDPSNGSGSGAGEMMEGPGDAGQPSPGQNAGCGKCGSAAGDGKNPWEDPAGADARNPDTGVTKIEQEMIGRQVAQAARDQEVKARGTVPGGVQMWANALLTPPKVDWRKELRRAVKSGMNWIAGLMDYTYTRPNRRSSGRIILPGFRKPLPRFCCILDCCLRGDMPVSMWDGSTKAVADVCVGDVVVGHRHGKAVPARVCDTFAYSQRELLAIELDDGRVVYSTGRHRFMRTDGSWVRADMLTAGTELVTVQGVCPTETSDAERCVAEPNTVDAGARADRARRYREVVDSGTRCSNRTSHEFGATQGIAPGVVDSAPECLDGRGRRVHARELQGDRRKCYCTEAEAIRRRRTDTCVCSGADDNCSGREPESYGRGDDSDRGREGLRRRDRGRRGYRNDQLEPTREDWACVSAAATHGLQYEHGATFVAGDASTLYQIERDGAEPWVPTWRTADGVCDDDHRIDVCPSASRDRAVHDHQEGAGGTRTRVHRQSRHAASDRTGLWLLGDGTRVSDLLARASSQHAAVKVRRVGGAGTADVFDLSTTTENYVVNGVVCHNSGSMSLNDYSAAFSEVASVIRVSGHKRVPMLACDAAVSEIQMVASIAEFKMTGGGGTDMGIGIRAAVEDHKMRLVFVFTDGVSPWIDRIDGVRVVVCLTRPESPSYPIPSWMTVVQAFDG